jgi:hypothetical protein
MKTLTIIATLVIIFKVSSVNAQFGSIAKYIRFGDSIQLIPDAPGNTDSIMIQVIVWSPTNTEKLTGTDVKIKRNIIEARACYVPSIAASPRNHSEWLKLPPLPTGLYTLRFIAYNGNYDCIYEDSVVAEYSFEVSGQPFIAIYPNPSDGDLYFDIYGKKVNGIRLLDISGRKIRELDPAEKYLNIKGLASGMYIVEIHTDTDVYRKKIHKR